MERSHFQARIPERITLSHITFASEETYTVRVTRLGKTVYYSEGKGSLHHFELGGRYDGIIELDRNTILEITMSEDGFASLFVEQWEVTECNTHVSLRRRFSHYFPELNAGDKWFVNFQTMHYFNAHTLNISHCDDIIIHDISVGTSSQLTGSIPASALAKHVRLEMGGMEFRISGESMKDVSGLNIQLVGSVLYPHSE